MDQTLRLGWMQARARSCLTVYKRVLGLSIALNIIVGILALIAPSLLARIAEGPTALMSSWLFAWGGMVILVTVLYLPGLIDPVRVRWPNVVGIIGRFGMAILFFTVALSGGEATLGLLWLALYDLVFAVALGILYFRLFEAELMTRP